jgi:hypothetical protein
VQLAAAGKPERRQAPEALVADLPRELDAFACELLDGGADVVAHQIQLVAPAGVGWMRGELGGRQREDEPAAAGVDRAKIQHVAEERAVRLGVAREDDGMNPGDHPLESDRFRAAARSGQHGVKAGPGWSRA